MDHDDPKSLCVALIEFGQKIEDILADGKIKVGEIVSVVGPAVEIWKLAKDGRQTYKEALDLDDFENE